jgi:hypothetical protein
MPPDAREEFAGQTEGFGMEDVEPPAQEVSPDWKPGRFEAFSMEDAKASYYAHNQMASMEAQREAAMRREALRRAARRQKVKLFKDTLVGGLYFLIDKIQDRPFKSMSHVRPKYHSAGMSPSFPSFFATQPEAGWVTVPQETGMPVGVTPIPEGLAEALQEQLRRATQGVEQEPVIAPEIEFPPFKDVAEALAWSHGLTPEARKAIESNPKVLEAIKARLSELSGKPVTWEEFMTSGESPPE